MNWTLWAELREAFSMYDKNKDGFLSVDEVTGILTRPGGGHPMTKDEATAFISRFDNNSDGKLNVEECISALQTMQYEAKTFRPKRNHSVGTKRHELH